MHASYHQELLSHCLIKLPELQYPARTFNVRSSELWDLSNLLKLINSKIDVCVCFVSFCLARAPASLKLLGTPMSRPLIYFLYTCLKPYKMYKSIN